MKLKKVVSLALAGVLAVSMLAGCGTNKKDGPTQDDNGTVKAGYSAEFGKIVDLKDMDYVTFQDSTVDQEALKAAVASCTDLQLYAALVSGNLDSNTVGGIVGGSGWLQGAMPISSQVKLNCVNVFTDKADLDFYSWNQNNGMPWYFATENDDKQMTDTLKAGAMFAVDGSMDTESVLTLVEELLADSNTLSDASLPETGVNGGISVDYKYTVSVSLVNRVASSSTLMTADMDFVAVTITRTGTVADA